MKLLRSAFILLLAMLLLATCSRASALPDGEWQLESLNGNPPVEDTEVTLVFEEERAGGSSGCNSYGGPVEVDGEKIQFGEMVMTLMACTDAGVMEQETSYLAALGAVETFKVEGEQLMLSGPEVELVFWKK
jgi:heat shock protein HslJ